MASIEAFEKQLCHLLGTCQISRCLERCERMCDAEDGGFTDWKDILKSSDVVLSSFLPKGKIGTFRMAVEALQTCAAGSENSLKLPLSEKISVSNSPATQTAITSPGVVSPKFPVLSPYSGSSYSGSPTSKSLMFSPRDEKDLSFTVADYCRRIDLWKITTVDDSFDRFDLSFPALPPKWVFRLGEMLHITSQQLPQFAALKVKNSPKIMREFQVHDPTVLEMIRVVSMDGIFLSWRFRGIAPGSTSVTLMQLHQGMRAEVDYDILVV